MDIRRRVFIAVCNMMAAICSGIVSYGYFYRGKSSPGILFFAYGNISAAAGFDTGMFY